MNGSMVAQLERAATELDHELVQVSLALTEAVTHLQSMSEALGRARTMMEAHGRAELPPL